MTDEVTSNGIRTRTFDVVRKGYDRNQVDMYLADIATHFDDFESRIAEFADGEIALGIDDAEALARELSTVGGEIGVILEAARSAAEGMRTRASADADSWTSEAKEYVEESTSEAESLANAVRGAGWDEGSGVLSAATERAETMVVEAETDALRIRAEAEREAIRYTNDAKRASEESIGAAENEAEGILQSSRAESERVLRAANQSAELAQERARALEDRRAELLSELESTRSSIGDLETEIESKRQALEEPDPVAAPEYDDRSHHDTDSGTVKIISGSKFQPLKPVDADSFVAEVAEMHRESLQPEDSGQGEESSQIEESSQSTVVSSQIEESERLEDSSQTEESSQIEESEQFTVHSHKDSERLTVDSQQPEEDSSQPEEELSEVSEPEPEADPIGSLFAQLREDSETDTRGQIPDTREEPGNGERDMESQSASEVVSLIPVQNAALRTIKRQLVDLQNDALEHLRTDKTWVPGEEFTDRFSEAFTELAVAVTDDGDDRGAAAVFATDLYDAVSSAVETAREAGSGDRAIAAATSKVFRTWRSDEAERRVLAIASDLSERG